MCQTQPDMEGHDSRHCSTARILYAPIAPAGCKRPLFLIVKQQQQWLVF